MNQEQNNFNLNGFNTQGNDGIPNNQPLNNQSFNQQQINSQPQPMNNIFESGNASNQNFNGKPPKKMNFGLIIGIIVAVGVVVAALIVTGIVFGGKSPLNGSNDSLNKENDVNDSFSTDKYSLIYDTINFDDEYWQEKNTTMPHMTNKECFSSRYTFQVLNQSGTSIDGNLLMPLQDNYTMYDRLTGSASGGKECEYFVKMEFNKDGIFYPNMMTGSLDGTSDDNFNFYVLDSEMNFNAIEPNFECSKKTSVEISGSEIIYKDNNWEISKYEANNTTYIYADYFMGETDNDYINFSAEINGKLDKKQLDEFINKFLANVNISMIEDDETKTYLENLRPSDDFVELKYDVIKFSDNFEMKTNNIRMRIWSSDNSWILAPYVSSTKNVNIFQWYDINWKNGLDRIQLMEYVNVGDINKVAEAKSGTNVEIKDYPYNNLNIKAIYYRNDEYRKSKGYSDITGFIFQVGDDVYTIQTMKYLTDAEIQPYLKYLFESVLIIKN